MIGQTIDPGLGMGRAQWVGVGFASKLVNCGLWEISEPAWACDWALIEDQVIYPRSKVPPNDIVTLAKTAARAAEKIGWAKTTWVAPRKWKGTVDPDVMLVRIVEQLSEREREVYFKAADAVAEGIRHNVIDAIGMGLWKFGRLPR